MGMYRIIKFHIFFTHLWLILLQLNLDTYGEMNVWLNDSLPLKPQESGTCGSNLWCDGRRSRQAEVRGMVMYSGKVTPIG